MSARRRASWAGHGDLAASAAMIFPLVLIYGIASAVTLQVHAVDVGTRALWRLCGADRQRYLVAYAALALGYLWWLRRHHRGDALRLSVLGPVIAESAIYAFTLATIVWFVVAQLPLGSDAVVGAVGAGVHEELVFRLLGVAGLAALAGRAGVAPRTAVVAAVVVSSLAFAAAHHLGGEPWAARAFAFRTAAGFLFAAVFWHRSLAHAVYAHVLYDLWIALA